MNEESSGYSKGFALGYLYAQAESNINSVVAQAGEQLSGVELAEGLATLLLSKAGRPLLRAANTLRALRGSATQGRKATRKVALARSARANKSLGVRNYWNSLSAAQKKKRIKNMLEARARNRALRNGLSSKAA